jgi:hypothetical protein
MLRNSLYKYQVERWWFGVLGMEFGDCILWYLKGGFIIAKADGCIDK